ncbi:MAG: DUF411 domain-containing protein [Rhizobiales bacterium]|nr:DUF411 domain-containing protein [Hyphomicrobiales bacterium]
MVSQSITRRRVLVTAVAATAGASGTLRSLAATGDYPAIQAYRNPGCGCCEKWAEGLRQAGFTVTMEDDPNLERRRAEAGVPAAIAGCHTAFMGDYVIEGHVPASDIKRLLSEKLEVRGLAVVGMPMGSPGMESGDAAEKYDVLAFTADGASTVFASY